MKIKLNIQPESNSDESRRDISELVIHGINYHGDKSPRYDYGSNHVVEWIVKNFIQRYMALTSHWEEGVVVFFGGGQTVHRYKSAVLWMIYIQYCFHQKIGFEEPPIFATLGEISDILTENIKAEQCFGRLDQFVSTTNAALGREIFQVVK